MLMTAKGPPLARGEAGRHIGKGAEIQAAGGTTAGGTTGEEGGGNGTEKGTTGEGGDQGNKYKFVRITNVTRFGYICTKKVGLSL